MSVKYKRIRTEYRGIVFDSKSEAVFARALDLAGTPWHYHPEPHCGHPWDFIVGMRYRLRGKIHTLPTYVEYKPSTPTQTYIDNLIESQRDDPQQSVIVFGSPWNPGEAKCYRAFPVFSTYWKYGWGDYWDELTWNDEANSYQVADMFGVTDEHAYMAKEYRFDLRQTVKVDTSPAHSGIRRYVSASKWVLEFFSLKAAFDEYVRYKCEVPDVSSDMLFRGACVEEQSDGTLIIWVRRLANDKQPPGWNSTDTKDCWTLVLNKPPLEERRLYEDIVCRRQMGQSEWYVRNEDGLFVRKSASSINMLLRYRGHSKQEVGQIMSTYNCTAVEGDLAT